jgi:hypothetical protein
MADLTGFDANSVPPLPEREPLPEGTYVVVIVESEMRPTKSGSGSFLELKMSVLEGPCQGRPLWARFNLQNPNPTAVQIAQAELGSLCRAVGILQPRDSSELHNLPLVVSVKCRRRADDGSITNEIRGYSPRATPGAHTPQAPVTPTTPPWRR